ncbi:GNAT family N-acetyltransferase [Actinomadura sp. 3N407]|uniref:GNAT family N-acetyltransferase n=1 Tax=Actinomadura sp. 3N407 TaxID=3457423 RepID=UPI003FCC319C
MITWRRVTEDDFALLRRWLRRPHVARWWNHDTSVEGVARGFGPAARGEEPSEDWLALLDGRPFGLVPTSSTGSTGGPGRAPDPEVRAVGPDRRPWTPWPPDPSMNFTCGEPVICGGRSDARRSVLTIRVCARVRPTGGPS